MFAVTGMAYHNALEVVTKLNPNIKDLTQACDPVIPMREGPSTRHHNEKCRSRFITATREDTESSPSAFEQADRETKTVRQESDQR